MWLKDNESMEGTPQTLGIPPLPGPVLSVHAPFPLKIVEKGPVRDNHPSRSVSANHFRALKIVSAFRRLTLHPTVECCGGITTEWHVLEWRATLRDDLRFVVHFHDIPSLLVEHNCRTSKSSLP